MNYMYGFPSMLANAAEKAGISVPDEPDNFEDERNNHPHFYVFCKCQLGQPLPFPGCHHNNARLISSLSVEEVKVISFDELLLKGFAC